MELIPAIDIINGKCVRLHQGDYTQVTHYSDNLPAIAEHWQKQGARWLHIVDLDGAKSGKPENIKSIIRVIQHCPTLHIEVGGGIRTRDTVARYIDLGITRVVIGSQAVLDPLFFTSVAEEFNNTIVLGIDSRDGQVMTHGWFEGSNISVDTLAAQFQHLPLAAIIHTDINRDGTLQGVNIKSTLALAKATSIPVFASGGVAGIEDIKRLHANKNILAGVILGKSLYEGRLDFAEALKLITPSHAC